MTHTLSLPRLAGPDSPGSGGWLYGRAIDQRHFRRLIEAVSDNSPARMLSIVLAGLVSVLWIGWVPALAWIAAALALHAFVIPRMFEHVIAPLIDTDLQRAARRAAALAAVSSAVFVSIWVWPILVTHEPLAFFRAALGFGVSAAFALVYFHSAPILFLGILAPIAAAGLAVIVLGFPDPVDRLLAVLLLAHTGAFLFVLRRDSFRHAEVTSNLGRDYLARHEVSESRGRFLANMSHELRTPLNAIIGFTEIVREEAEAEGRLRDVADLDRVRTASAHLLTMINDVLDLSRAEAGALVAKPESIDAAAYFAELIEESRALADQNGNRLTLALDPGVVRFESDRAKLRQCVDHLVSNACKFTREGDVSVRVAFVGDGADRLLRIDVSDTGLGMSPSDVARLFEPFAQIADAAAARRTGPGGIGLALTRRLAQLLDGDLTVRSELGVGSTFTLTVGAPDLSQFAGAGEGTAVLHVEDSPSARDFVRRALQGLPVQVVSVGTAAAAIDAVARLKPRLVLLDIHLPDESGWRVLEHIRESDGGASLPVIIHSVDADSALSERFGVRAHIVKPCPRILLRSQVAAILTERGLIAPPPSALAS